MTENCPWFPFTKIMNLHFILGVQFGLFKLYTFHCFTT